MWPKDSQEDGEKERRWVKVDIAILRRVFGLSNEICLRDQMTGRMTHKTGADLVMQGRLDQRKVMKTTVVSVCTDIVAAKEMILFFGCVCFTIRAQQRWRISENQSKWQVKSKFCETTVTIFEMYKATFCTWIPKKEDQEEWCFQELAHKF
jgi:hypothetical protein